MPIQQPKPKPIAMAATTLPLTISFVGGSKGGVGKSFCCRGLYEYHLARRLPIVGFEADLRTPDFAGIYTEIKTAGHCVHFSEDENQATAPNALINTAIREKVHIVVNLPAAVEPGFQTWLEATPVLAIAQQKQIRLINWFVCSGEYDSTEALKASLRQFGDVLPHVVVRNRKFADWSLFEADQDLAQLIQQYRCPAIDLPRLNVRIAGTLLKQRLTYTQALTYEDDDFSFAEQSSVQTFLNNFYTAIDTTGYFAHAN
jgi:hypothetical protein